MAQAARLNLRMQKELKLLLTDPPPGASFPLLSSDSDSDLSSLSTIDAEIEGPEGTVYAKGIFKIRIQIPERYPFQPPSVTFATPIYHPNIDNGGRICLDILNLPPKGAWQPSLNISTVLTSIGLLLSEPNPDDGLMCEASREFKYNRQTFDQKARSMTEKYAKPGAGGNGCTSQGLQSNSSLSSMTELRGTQKYRIETSQSISNHKKPCEINQKVALESSSSSQQRDHEGEVTKAHNKDEMEAKGKRKQINVIIPSDCNPSAAELHSTRRKLSLESSNLLQRHEKKNTVPHNDFLSNLQPVSVASLKSSSQQSSNFGQHNFHHHHKNSESTNGSVNMGTSLETFQISGHNNEKIHAISSTPPSQSQSGASSTAFSSSCNVGSPCKDAIDGIGKSSIDANCEKICSVGKKLSLGSKYSSQLHVKSNKENVAPIQKQLSSPQSSFAMNKFGRKLSLGPLTQLQGNNENNSHSPWEANSIRADCGCNEKKQYNEDHSGTVAGETERQKTEEPFISDSAIVLDSEDSEEEMDSISRSKLSLARKPMGKWRAKA